MFDNVSRVTEQTAFNVGVLRGTLRLVWPLLALLLLGSSARANLLPRTSRAIRCRPALSPAWVRCAGGTTPWSPSPPSGPTARASSASATTAAIRVWEFPSGKEIRRIAASSQAVQSMNAAALTADGKTIATSFNLVNGAENEQVIHLHDVATGKESAPLKFESGTINDLTFSPDGRHLTSRDAGGTVRIWDWAKAKELARFDSPAPALAVQVHHRFRTLCFLRVVRRGSNKDLLAYAPDGKALMFYGLSQVPRFVEAPSGKEILSGTGHREPIASVWFTPDGKHLLTKASDGSLHKWDAASSKDLGLVKLPAPSSGRVFISPDGGIGLHLPDALTGGRGRGGRGGFWWCRWWSHAGAGRYFV